MTQEEECFARRLHARTEESKVVHFVGPSTLGSNSGVGREAKRSEIINVRDYCVVRGDPSQGSPPWWIGLILAVTLENGTVSSISVQECGDESFRNQV